MPRTVVERLKAMGHDVVSVVEAGLQGAPDLAIVERAAAEARTVLTQDLDFGRIFVERDPPVRIVVLRSPDPRASALVRMVEAFLKHLDLEDPRFREGLFVVGPRGHRHRKRSG